MLTLRKVPPVGEQKKLSQRSGSLRINLHLSQGGDGENRFHAGNFIIRQINLRNGCYFLCFLCFSLATA